MVLVSAYSQATSAPFASTSRKGVNICRSLRVTGRIMTVEIWPPDHARRKTNPLSVKTSYVYEDDDTQSDFGWLESITYADNETEEVTVEILSNLVF